MKKNSRIMKLKNIILTYLIGVALFACEDPYEGTTYLAYDELPVASYLDSRTEKDLSLWVDLLNYTGLYSTLNLNTEYTAFVPNNKAMSKYLSSNGYSSVTDIDSTYANFLVKYHILHGKILKQDEFASGIMTWPTAIDEYLSISFGDEGINSIYINNTSRIDELDIEVTNGVVHVIEEVLIPVVETIWDRINTDRYSIMQEAVEITGYTALLDTVEAEALNQYGQTYSKRFYYTLFAISDSIYNINGITSLNDLISKVGASNSDYTNTDNLLNRYVSYHIVEQTQSYTALAEFDEDVFSKNINTLAEKELINFSPSENNLLWINYNSTDSTGVSIINNDISCKNGVMHEVNSWMPVTTPPTTIVDWDLANYSDMAAICTYFQSPNPRGGSGTYEKVIPADEVDAYYWEPIPLSKPDVITYINNRNNDGVYYEAMFHDHLEISTGPAGWVEIKSPVIVKGTYKITLQYISYRNEESVGEMQCYMDGVKLGSSFFMSNTDQEKLTTRSLSNSITFDETDEHTLRIVGIDGSKLTLDYIKFEPIN